MRYELKNLAAAPFYCVEAAKLVKPGESIRVSRLDEGTRRLAEGAKPRLAIVDLAEAATAQPDSVPKTETTAPSTPTQTNAKGKDSQKLGRGTAQDAASRLASEAKADAPAPVADPSK